MRRNISFKEMEAEYPDAYSSLWTDGYSPEEFFSLHDEQFYEYLGELYSESHDNRTHYVWRDGAWIERPFDDRPAENRL